MDVINQALSKDLTSKQFYTELIKQNYSITEALRLQQEYEDKLKQQRG